MSEWISVKKRLPKINMPVLCIVKANCGCEHYIAAILARANVDDEWMWLASNPQDGGFIQFSKELVLSWRFIEKFPNKYPEGFER